MRIVSNYLVNNMKLSFSNGYTVSVSQKDKRSGLSWIAYWSTLYDETISVNEGINDDKVADFIECIRKLEPAHLTKGVKNIIEQSIMNKFGG